MNSLGQIGQVTETVQTVSQRHQSLQQTTMMSGMSSHPHLWAHTAKAMVEQLG